MLDAGCGEGYGTAMLAGAGPARVAGVDNDRDVLAHARERYGLEFVEADIVGLPFEDASFDLVVCFETIEHVADGPRALSELRRVLAPKGLLIVSTPNAGEYLVENEFHEREYEPAEFDELLAEQFAERHRLYQQNWLMSAILDEQQLRADGTDSRLDVDLVKAVGIEPGRELYSVIICGSLDRSPPQVAVASGVYEANRMAADLADAERQRKAWRERAATAERQREAWQERATTAERQREAWEERAAKAEQSAEAWERQAHQVERQVDDLAEAIRTIQASLSWRITKPLRILKALLRRTE